MQNASSVDYEGWVRQGINMVFKEPIYKLFTRIREKLYFKKLTPMGGDPKKHTINDGSAPFTRKKDTELRNCRALKVSTLSGVPGVDTLFSGGDTSSLFPSVEAYCLLMSTLYVLGVGTSSSKCRHFKSVFMKCRHFHHRGSTLQVCLHKYWLLISSVDTSIADVDTSCPELDGHLKEFVDQEKTRTKKAKVRLNPGFDHSNEEIEEAIEEDIPLGTIYTIGGPHDPDLANKLRGDISMPNARVGDRAHYSRHPLPLNAIVGQDWLHRMRRVASTLHQVITFVTPEGEETLYGDQVEAKQCYLTTISTNAIMKKVQLVKEEHEVLEDVGRNPEAKVVEDLIRYELDEPSKPERTRENRARPDPYS
ncbi:hypothetical protein Acr_06g0006810 [Actinidia rufa]|uniref:Uncharacterized protein n=1 Tax=Actinidia rufa TaxID=165716 RepID=A0A7J0EQH9_9ERIC|nr:hypothetical protein Acr_06g0006810 [Actinidia rufa]